MILDCDDPFILIQVLAADPLNTELSLPAVHFYSIFTESGSFPGIPDFFILVS